MDGGKIMRMFAIWIMFLGGLFLSGCLAEKQCKKEKSYFTALDILFKCGEDDVFDRIKLCDDVDALRIVAFSSSVAAWPMEAGENVNFDNRLDDIFQMAMNRLYTINSESAYDSVMLYKRAFPPDGACSILFKEWEENRSKIKRKP